MGSQQANLFSGTFSGEERTIKGEKQEARPPAKKNEVRKTDKKVNLQDFM
jgi:hypothetical protein